MGYWKSAAAEVLPSWLKNRRKGGLARNTAAKGHEAVMDKTPRPIQASDRSDVSGAASGSRPATRGSKEH